MSSEQNVLIRVDAGMGIGFGHLTRCLSLARQLIGLGASVTVATRAEAPEILSRIRGAGAVLLQLPGTSVTEHADGPVWDPQRQRADADVILDYAPNRQWDAVVVDHYQLDGCWEQLLAPAARWFVAIDDLANRRHSVDVIVDHNWYGRDSGQRYNDLVDENTQLLLGPRYAILDTPYVGQRRIREPVRNPPERVMVSFGGTDVGNQSVKAVRALLDFPTIDVEVVLGTWRVLNAELERLATQPRVRLHVALPSLAGLMSTVDLVIGAGGTATWERLCMGLPAIVTTVSENQSGVTRAFHQAGITKWLGSADSVGVADYHAAVTEALTGQVPSPPPIVDGHGAARVALAVLPPVASHLTARAATTADVASFVTAGLRGVEGPAVWDEEARLFFQRLSRGDTIEVLELGETPVGTRLLYEGAEYRSFDQYLDRHATILEAS